MGTVVIEKSTIRGPLKEWHTIRRPLYKGVEKPTGVVCPRNWFIRRHIKSKKIIRRICVALQRMILLNMMTALV